MNSTKMRSIKLQNFCTKKKLSEAKMPPTKWVKIDANDIFDRS